MHNILGIVDGVDRNALHGWIANRNRPERLERVVCSNAAGESIVFVASLPRQDVSEALSLRGRFGFAIPLSSLMPLGNLIVVSGADGTILEKGEAVYLPYRSIKDDNVSYELKESPILSQEKYSICPYTYAFLHIPKTAGTTLRVMLETSYDPGEIMFVYDDGISGITSAELGVTPILQRRALRMILGHMYFGVGLCMPQTIKYLTFLRNTKDRLESNRRHHLQQKTMFACGGTIVDANVALTVGCIAEFDNMMTRVLSGIDEELVPIGDIDESHVEIALSNVRNSFRFVGHFDNIGEHYEILSGILGINHESLRTLNKGSVETITERDIVLDWDRIMHRNRMDNILVKRLFDEDLVGRDLLKV